MKVLVKMLNKTTQNENRDGEKIKKGLSAEGRWQNT